MTGEYQHTPLSVGRAGFFVGTLVLLETHRRINGNAFGPMPKPLTDDAHNMGGYCIDAPELIPAGACVFHSFGPEPDDWLVEQVTIQREGGA